MCNIFIVQLFNSEKIKQWNFCLVISANLIFFFFLRKTISCIIKNNDMRSSDIEDIIIEDNDEFETIQLNEIKTRNFVTSFNEIENLLDKNEQYKRYYHELSDIIVRIHSVKGVPSPTKEMESTDLYWQLDMDVPNRYTSKTVYIYYKDNDNCDTRCASWFEDVFIRRYKDESLLLTLRCDSLGYNASFGKLFFPSIEDIIKDVDDDEIICDWFPLELNFKSTDPNVSYDIQVYLSFIKLPTVKYENDESSFICSPPNKRPVSIIPNPHGSYPGSSIQCLVALNVENDGDKIEKDDFVISVESESAAFLKGKLERRIERGFFFQPYYDSVRISYPNLNYIMNDDGILIDKGKSSINNRNQRSIFSFFRSPVNLCFKTPKTYLWILHMPLPGKCDAVDSDNNVIETCLSPSFKFGEINLWEPFYELNNNLSFYGACETRHRIKAGYTNNETMVDFTVHPLHRLDAPQSIQMKFKSPFNPNEVFALRASFIVRNERNYEFNGSIERESNHSSTSIISASFELKSCLSFKNSVDDLVKSSFSYIFKDNSGLLKERDKHVDFSASSQEPLIGYTMNTPLYSIDHYLIPTIVFTSEGENQKKILNGISIGIYPTIGKALDENAFEELSNRKLDESMLRLTEIDSEKYVIFPNIFYHPKLKTLTDIPNEEQALIYDRETGKQVSSKIFFSD